MIDAIVARADGIPLYLEELTRTILEPGTARRRWPTRLGDPASRHRRLVAISVTPNPTAEWIAGR
jgi:hypothetical protein